MSNVKKTNTTKEMLRSFIFKNSSLIFSHISNFDNEFILEKIFEPNRQILSRNVDFACELFFLVNLLAKDF